MTRIGMSAPADEWNARLAEVGTVYARRLFSSLDSPTSALALAAKENVVHRTPVMSFKVPGNDWTGAAAGKYDPALKAITKSLDAIPGKIFATVHHEPAGNGNAADYAKMMEHVLPILGSPVNVVAGPIVNGFWWSARGQGMTDQEIAQWLPPAVLAVSEIVGADCYQGGTTSNPGEDAGVKIANMSKWATRVGVQHLGIGEYNGLNAVSIAAAGKAVLADSRFQYACVFNSNVNNRTGVSWQLTGDRVTAFKATLAASRA